MSQPAYLAQWQHLVTARDRASKLSRHLAPMADGDACREILTQLAERVLTVSIDDPPHQLAADGAEKVLHIVLPYCEDGEVLDEETPIDLWCYPPFEGSADPSVPSSYLRVARLHARFLLKDRQYDVPFIWWGLNASGLVAEAASHHPTFHRGGTDGAFVSRLEASGSTLHRVRVPINAIEDWYLLNPLELGADGEPRWSRVSLETGTVGPAIRKDLSLAAGLLRILTRGLVDHPDALTSNDITGR